MFAKGGISMKKVDINELLNQWKMLEDEIIRTSYMIRRLKNKVNNIDGILEGKYLEHSFYLKQMEDTKLQVKSCRHDMFDKTLNYLIINDSEKSQDAFDGMEQSKKKYYDSLKTNKRVRNRYFENFEQNSELDAMRCKCKDAIRNLKIKLFQLIFKQHFIEKKIVNYLGYEEFHNIIEKDDIGSKSKSKRI